MVFRSKAGSAKQKKQRLSEISPKRIKTGAKSKITQSKVSKPSKLPKQEAVPTLDRQEKGKSKKALDGDQRYILNSNKTKPLPIQLISYNNIIYYK